MSASPARQVVTRFAPSPTGALHVGGARTALFNWAYARRHGGRFILRFEDTDRKRSSEQSAQSMLDDLKWLGIDFDDGPFRQSERLNLYNEHIDRLLADGRAYEDDGAVRFGMDSDVAFDDAVYGHIEVSAGELEDFVIRKADGFPTFHLAVIVDDALMNVTHVIRGQEHLTNTTKHVALQDALDFPRPVFAHTPTILNPDGSKMSKRDKENGSKEVDVADFRRSGYLPDVLCNFFALLGWSPGNDVERFDTAFLTEHFSLDRINKSNAKFDREKLQAFNGDTIRQMPPDDWHAMLAGHIKARDPQQVEKLGDHFALFADCYHQRSQTLDDPVRLGKSFFVGDDDLEYDDKAVKKQLTRSDGEGMNVLRQLAARLEACSDWSPTGVDEAVKAFAGENELGLGKVAQPLRVAVMGNAVSPPIGDTLAILGKAATLARIGRCLQLFGK